MTTRHKIHTKDHKETQSNLKREHNNHKKSKMITERLKPTTKGPKTMNFIRVKSLICVLGILFVVETS